MAIQTMHLVDDDASASLKQTLTIHFSIDDYDSQHRRALAQKGKTAKLKGYRPGKVPMSVLEQYYGHAAQIDVVEANMRTAFNEAVKEKGIQFVGKVDFEPEGDFLANMTHIIFHAHFERLPEITPSDLKTTPIERLVAELSDADIARELENLQNKEGTWQAVADDVMAADTHQVTIDFEGRIDGAPFDGGTANDFPFVLGEGRMLADFETHVKGQKVGAEITFTMTFPQNYAKEVAGKTCEFTVKVKRIEERAPANLDTLVEKFKLADSDALKNTIRTNMEAHLRYRVLVHNKQACFDALLAENADFLLPEGLLDAEYDAHMARLKTQYQMKDDKALQDNISDEMRDFFTEEAARHVRLGLLLRHFRSTLASENLKNDAQDGDSAKNVGNEKEQEMRELIVNQALMNQSQSPDALLKDKNFVQQLQVEMEETILADKLMERMKFEAKVVDYEAFLAHTQKAAEADTPKEKASA